MQTRTNIDEPTTEKNEINGMRVTFSFTSIKIYSSLVWIENFQIDSHGFNINRTATSFAIC